MINKPNFALEKKNQLLVEARLSLNMLKIVKISISFIDKFK